MTDLYKKSNLVLRNWTFVVAAIYSDWMIRTAMSYFILVLLLFLLLESFDAVKLKCVFCFVCCFFVICPRINLIVHCVSSCYFITACFYWCRFSIGKALTGHNATWATAGPGETFLRAPSWEKVFEFFSLKWCVLVYFILFERWQGPPNVTGPGVA